MRITRNSISACVVVLGLSACSTAQPDPTPAPAPVAKAPTPAPTPAPVKRVDNWTEWPISVGEWVYRQDSRGSLALFGARNTDALVTLRCDQSQKKIFLSQAGTARTGGQMVLRASSGLQTYPAQITGGTPPYSAVTIAPDDIMLDRIAFSRGRFAIESSGLSSIAVPVQPEFARVVEDCRS